MKPARFTLHDLFWLVLVVGLAIGWAIDRSQLNHFGRTWHARAEGLKEVAEPYLNEHSMGVDWENNPPVIIVKQNRPWDLPVEVVSSDPAGGVLHSNVIGASFTSEITPEALAASPSWGGDSPNPPSAALEAVQRAETVRKELVADDKDYQWRVLSIRLEPGDSAGRKWYWCVHFVGEFVGEGGFTGALPELELAVLMNGEVVRPTKSPRAGGVF